MLAQEFSQYRYPTPTLGKAQWPLHRISLHLWTPGRPREAAQEATVQLHSSPLRVAFGIARWIFVAWHATQEGGEPLHALQPQSDARSPECKTPRSRRDRLEAMGPQGETPRAFWKVQEGPNFEPPCTDPRNEFLESWPRYSGTIKLWGRMSFKFQELKKTVSACALLACAVSCATRFSPMAGHGEFCGAGRTKLIESTVGSNNNISGQERCCLPKKSRCPRVYGVA